MAMLTDVARAKTQELGLSVAPPVKDTATYRVGDCETVGELMISSMWQPRGQIRMQRVSQRRIM